MASLSENRLFLLLFYRCCWPVLCRLQRKAGISDKPPRRSLP